MRIIAGEFRGRSLQAPKGTATRPTTDRVRESMMSVVASARGGFSGAVVLDAFAGSGALGLEAISRGAACAVFYECAPDAFRVVRGNIAALGLSAPAARLRKADVLAAPPTRVAVPFDLVFLDPPYDFEPERVLAMPASLAAAGALAPGALVVYEHAARCDEAAASAARRLGFSLAQHKKYGDTVVDTLRLHEQEGNDQP